MGRLLGGSTHWILFSENGQKKEEKSKGMPNGLISNSNLPCLLRAPEPSCLQACPPSRPARSNHTYGAIQKKETLRQHNHKDGTTTKKTLQHKNSVTKRCDDDKKNGEKKQKK